MSQASHALNGICPHFTMFPLVFPYSVLSRLAGEARWIVDPFCGRGTTNYASRLLGIPSVGIDSSPVAAAIAQSKLANTRPSLVLRAAEQVLQEVPEPIDPPEGEFWQWAFHPRVLAVLCRLREGLRRSCASDSRKALRAILLGALHGPKGKTKQAYLSNQCPRTFAPKPAYSVRFWKERGLRPEDVDVFGIIEDRALRFYGSESTHGSGRVLLADSRDPRVFSRMRREVDCVLTSPPYYGMRTYISDQWLRQWFLGGPSVVDYSGCRQLLHSSPQVFAAELRKVWQNLGSVCIPGAHLVVRFGGINDRSADPMGILGESFCGTKWALTDIVPAGSASEGRRQANHFSACRHRAATEFDVWGHWAG